jgi:hypothetical protein
VNRRYHQAEGKVPMTRFNAQVAAVATVGAVVIVGAAGVSPRDLLHRSSLRATITMADGTVRHVTVQGVGCPRGMCSRVRAKDVRSESVWLDGLTSVCDISHEPTGPITATFAFRNGAQHRASVVEANRVLYLHDGGRGRQLDLSTVRKIDFQ